MKRNKVRRMAAQAALAWIATGASTSPASPLSGDWVGQDQVSSAPSSLRLSIDKGSGAVLRFGAGRNCTLLLRAVGGAQAPTGFAITESNGGRFCDRLVPGTLQLAAKDDAQLSVSLSASDRRYGWTLRRAGGAADPVLHGAWAGWLQPAQSSVPVDVRLDVGGTEPGDADSLLRQGGTRQCQVGLAYQGAAGTVHYFQALMRQVAGGYCEALVDRLLRVESDGRTLRYSFIPDDGQCGKGCVLERVPR
ncbi:hypothetical protein [Pseudoxanthomonas suwonensis]|uniref:hypothetical protein n=1 Tax=Pseudoxanthomonas suwonensis TaxID=314722 RepID=UPI00138F282D|nr:hypothetical protein [Pseudoxanthomonas suwonensis]KAF1705705.1 hypothetical protein CSC68_00515 [Pseudoxanthomonas suwonensis]